MEKWALAQNWASFFRSVVVAMGEVDAVDSQLLGS